MQVLHDKLLQKVLTLPMTFFDTQPSGRLMARLTHDVEATDIDLQDIISYFVMCFAAVLVALAVVTVVTKGFVLLALAPVIPVYLTVQSYYLATSRELNRLNSVSRSPIYSNFSETLAGMMTVRAFRKQVWPRSCTAQLLCSCFFRLHMAIALFASPRLRIPMAWFPLLPLNLSGRLNAYFMGEWMCLLLFLGHALPTWCCAYMYFPVRSWVDLKLSRGPARLGTSPCPTERHLSSFIRAAR
jgi:ABC-type multidrug transport system fused ATPase/permease subunit